MLPFLGMAQPNWNNAQWDYDFEQNNIRYHIDGANSVTVARSPDATGTIQIEAAVYYSGNTYTVTSIGNHAFRYHNNDNNNLTAVVIPGTVTSIGEYAFSYQRSLSNVKLSEGLISIGIGAFRSTALPNIKFPESLESIGDSAFNFISNFSGRLTIPPNVTYLGFGIFQSANITEVRSRARDPYYIDYLMVGDNLWEWGSSPFGSGKIPTIDLFIPPGYEAIYESKRWNSRIKFKSLNYGFQVEGIYYRVNGVKTVEVMDGPEVTQGSNLVIPEQVAYNGILYTVNHIKANAFEGKELTSVVIPETITNIESSAFAYNNLTSVTIPSSVTKIGAFSFANNQLTEVIMEDAPLGSNNTTIHNAAFQNNQLSSVTIPVKITNMSNNVFNGNPLTEVIVERMSTPTIDINTFNKSAIDLIIPLGSLPAYEANSNWAGFKSVSQFLEQGNISYKITVATNKIAEVIESPEATGALEIPEKITTSFDGYEYTVSRIKSNAFYNNGITTVSIPETVIAIEDNAFKNNQITEIKSTGVTAATIINNGNSNTFDAHGAIDLVIPAGSLSDYQNKGWTGFNYIEIFSQDDYNFRVISGTTNVAIMESPDKTGAIEIPETVDYLSTTYTIVEIDEEAFQNNRLTSVSIPESIISIKDNAFKNNQITEIKSSGVTAATIINNGNSNTFDAHGAIDLVIPAGSLSDYQNKGWTGFNHIEIFSQDDYNFRVISGTTNVAIMVSPNKTGAIEIPKTVDYLSTTYTIVEIDEEAFQNNGLTSVNIPAGVTIGNYAFTGNALVSITCQGDSPITVADITGAPRFDSHATIDLVIPAGAKMLYDNKGWSGFRAYIQIFSHDDFWYRIITGTTDVVVIESPDKTGAIVIPETVEYLSTTYTIIEIDDAAFKNNGLTEVTIPDSVTAIGNNAFQGNQLTHINIPASVITIGSHAFTSNVLTLIECQASTAVTIANISGSARFDSHAGIDLTIPPGTQTLYDNKGWLGFKSSIEIFSENGFNYRIISETDKTVAVMVSPDKIGVIEIPETVAHLSNNYTVIEIDDAAFQNNGLTEVTIPDSMLIIGEGAFQGNQLTRVVIPEKVTNIGDYAFYNNQLVEVESKNQLAPTIAADTFDNRSLIDLLVPIGTLLNYQINGWTGFRGAEEIFSKNNINYRVVVGVNNVVEVIMSPDAIGNIEIPEQVTYNNINYAVFSIDENAFSSNTLTDLIIPESVVAIEADAFYDNQLTRIRIPESVTSIGERAFNSNDLTRIIIPENMNTLSNHAFSGNTLVEVLSKGTTASTIDVNTFDNRGDIDLVIPFGTEVEYQSKDWIGFKSVSFFFEQDDIYYKIISGTTTVEVIVSPDKTGALEIPEKVTHQSIAYDVIGIGFEAFRGNQLSSVIIPESVTTIKTGAFYNNALTRIVIPEYVTGIEDEAFFGNSLTIVDAKGMMPSDIELNTFGDRNVIDLFIPSGTLFDYDTNGWTGFKSITQIFSRNDFNYKVISGTNNFVEVVSSPDKTGGIEIPEKVTYNGNEYTTIGIEESAFEGNQLTSVVIPQSVLHIKSKAFKNNQLTEVVIPENMTAILADAFSGNPLTEVRAEGVISPVLLSQAFGGNRSVIDLLIPAGRLSDYEDNRWTGFKSVSQVFEVDDINYKIISGTDVEVIASPNKTGAIEIPEKVTYKGVEYTITSIGKSAFQDNDLTGVTIPETVTHIGACAFCDNKLNRIIIPKNVTTIKERAFYDNILTSIVFPVNVIDIENYAFSNNLITEITCQSSTAPSIDTDTFGNKGNIDLTISAGTLSDYKSNGWTGFKSISYVLVQDNINYMIMSGSQNIAKVVASPNASGAIEIRETVLYEGTLYTVTQIGEGAFQDSSITDVTMPESISTIEDYAFYSHTLTMIKVKGVYPPIIKANTFANHRVIDLVIPAGTLSNYEFRGWTNFKSVTQVFEKNQINYKVISEGSSNTVAIIKSPDVTGALEIQEKVSYQGNTYSVISIIEEAFRGNQLTSVIIPGSIVEIEDYTFYDNAITIVDAKGAIAATIADNTFDTRSNIDLVAPAGTGLDYEDKGWTGFKNISYVFDKDGINYRVIPGVINTVDIMVSPNIIGTIDIPEQVKHQNIIYTVRGIDANAFITSQLTDVVISGSITEIGDYTFSNNPLTQVEAKGETAPVIEANTFGDRSGVALIIPVGTLSDYQTKGWTGFKNVTQVFEQNNINYRVISNVFNTAEVMVSPEATGAVEIPNEVNHAGTLYTVTSIGATAFQNNQLTHVTIPESVITIGDHAFSGHLLTEVTAEGFSPAVLQSENAFGDDREDIDLVIPQGTFFEYQEKGWIGFKTIYQENGEVLSVHDAHLNKAVNLLFSNKRLTIKAPYITLKQYSIYDMSGALVAQGSDKTIALEMLSKGVYIVKLQFDKGTVFEKFVCK